MGSSSHPARGKPSGKLSPGNVATTREREREGGLLQAEEAEDGSSKVHQFQDSFHFISKTSGSCQRRGYRSGLHTVACDSSSRSEADVSLCRDVQQRVLGQF